MTVIAIGRGPDKTYNLLLADTTVDTSQGKYEAPKVGGCGERDYCSAVGDETVKDAAQYLAMFHEPRQLNFRDPDTAKACYEGGNKRRIMFNVMGKPLMPVTKTELFVIGATEAFVWSAPMMPSGLFGALSPLTDITPGEIWIFYAGGPPVKFKMTPDFAKPFAEPEKYIGQEHSSKPASHRLNLLRFKFAGVMVPHDAALPIQHMWPFKDVADMWARSSPELMPGKLDLAKNPLYAAPMTVPKFK